MNEAADAVLANARLTDENKELRADNERLRALIAECPVCSELERYRALDKAREGKAERPGPPYDAAYEQNKRRR